MATTITAATIAPVLRDAADKVAALPHARVNSTNVHHAINESASQYDIAEAALNVLAAHMDPVGDAVWLNCWAQPRSRDEVATLMREAAESAVQVPDGED